MQSVGKANERILITVRVRLLLLETTYQQVTLAVIARESTNDRFLQDPCTCKSHSESVWEHTPNSRSSSPFGHTLSDMQWLCRFCFFSAVAVLFTDWLHRWAMEPLTTTQSRLRRRQEQGALSLLFINCCFYCLSASSICYLCFGLPWPSSESQHQWLTHLPFWEAGPAGQGNQWCGKKASQS
jgi:hypothetical protein